MFPWKTIIQIDKQSSNPIYLQIVNAVMKEISQGRLQAGQKLPGSRQLGELIGLNRKTVANAYDELMGQGWVDIIPSSGVFVTKDLPMAKYKKLVSDKETGGKMGANYQIVEKGFAPLRISPFKTSVIEINGGAPDERIAPMGNLYKNCRAAVNGRWSRRYMTYGQVEGELSLRQVLQGYLAETRGLQCGLDNIFITPGSQMAIFLIFQALLNLGDNVVVGDTNYPEADMAITYAGGNLLRVPVDEKGICVDRIEGICKNTGIKAMYITPHHHYPTTVTLSVERRVRLLSLAQKYGFAIIEDDYDYDFHYRSSPILPLASLDVQGNVIYIGSFSKLLAPTVRVGFAVAAPRLLVALNKIRQVVDRQGDHITQFAIAEMIKDGELQRHLKKALRVYKHRRDLFCMLLKKTMGELVSFEVPDGGMAVWVKFAPEIKLKRLFEDLYIHGLSIRVDEQHIEPANSIRLGFASLNEKEIKKAVTLLHNRVNVLFFGGSLTVPVFLPDR